jgi:hypothetical protein
MKNLFQVSILAIAIGCTSSKTSSDTVSMTDSTEVMLPQVDTLMTDSLSYVGFIDRFENNGDFYTDLYSRRILSTTIMIA